MAPRNRRERRNPACPLLAAIALLTSACGPMNGPPPGLNDAGASAADIDPTATVRGIPRVASTRDGKYFVAVAPADEAQGLRTGENVMILRVYRAGTLERPDRTARIRVRYRRVLSRLKTSFEGRAERQDDDSYRAPVMLKRPGAWTFLVSIDESQTSPNLRDEYAFRIEIR